MARLVLSQALRARTENPRALPVSSGNSARGSAVAPSHESGIITTHRQRPSMAGGKDTKLWEGRSL
jgi:hypothetical protein